MVFRRGPESSRNEGNGATTRRIGASSATIGFIAILCVVVVGHDLLRTWEDRSRQIDQTRREVANLVGAADQHAQDVFRLATLRLVGLSERMTTEGVGPESVERMRRLVAAQQENAQLPMSSTVIDASGTLLLDGSATVPKLNFSDRPYFQYHLTHPGLDPVVSTVLRSRLSDKAVVVVSRRVNGPNGEFAGVVTSAVNVDYFQAFYATFDLGHDGLTALYRDDGVLLVRQPPRGTAVGVSAANSQLFHDALPRAPNGTIETVSSLDGVTRIVSYRRVAGYPLVVVTALGKNEQLTVWRTGAAEHLLAAIVLAVLLCFVGVRLVIQVRRLTKAERATAAATTQALTAAAQYRLIADNASDMVVTLDLQFIQRYVSPGCRDLLGYKPPDLVGLSPIDQFHPDDAERVTACLAAVANGREHETLIYRTRHRDGTWIWVEASFRLIRDPGSGAPLEICAALRDTSQRMAAENTLRARDRDLERSNADLRELKAQNIASRYARGLLEASHDPMLMISPEGEITDVNEATIRLTGVSREALVGTDFSRRFTEPARAAEGYRRVLVKGSITDFKVTIRDRNDEPIRVLCNASVYKGADGAVLGVFAAVREMTAEMEIADQRTNEQERLEDLELFRRLSAARELETIELKNEIRRLKRDPQFDSRAVIPAATTTG
jgi:PAS domain S-box-containing protein